MITLDKLEFVPFITEREIEQAVRQISQSIKNDFLGKTPIFIGVLNGSFVFLADLMKYYNGPCKVDFIKVKSYIGKESTGKVNEIIGLENPNGKPVIIVEDIVDTGNTIDAIVLALLKKGITNYKIASLFFKPNAYKKPHKIDYVGIEIADDFIVGHGLDYKGLGRNLADVYKIKQ